MLCESGASQGPDPTLRGAGARALTHGDWDSVSVSFLSARTAEPCCGPGGAPPGRGGLEGSVQSAVRLLSVAVSAWTSFPTRPWFSRDHPQLQRSACSGGKYAHDSQAQRHLALALESLSS